MDTHDLTLEILINIRDEIRQTNKRLDETKDELGRRITQLGETLGQRIDQTNQRIDETNQRADRTNQRVTEFGTALIGLDRSVRDIHALLRDRFDLRDRVERCERDIDELKRRVG